MARDRAPKERQRRHLERKLNRRSAYDRILIVSEGSKTEPNYFGEIRASYRLPTADVVVRPSEHGTASIQVVEYAKELFEAGDRHRRIQARAFDQIFAVFDRDDHLSYADALHLAESLDHTLKNNERQRVRFRAIASVPCFELWLLLHYEDVAAPVSRDEALRRLRRYLPNYSKGATDSFLATRAQLNVACQRAELLATRFTAHDAPEPYTAVFELVRTLTSLRG